LAPRADEKHGAFIVTGIIVLRALLAGVFWLTYTRGYRWWALGCVIITFGTDVLDGHLSRRFRASASVGPYLDALADFIFVVTAFAAFVRQGDYPAWLLILIGLMFLQFVLSSGLRRPVYDPIGKYYGAMLFAAVGATVAFPRDWIRRVLELIIVAFTATALISRLAFLHHRGTARRSRDER
jgi:CDP-diacylglycerol--glycerol-3-phosphate 3-phosphatidyltransferase/cardiolipin synthase